MRRTSALQNILITIVIHKYSNGIRDMQIEILGMGRVVIALVGMQWRPFRLELYRDVSHDPAASILGTTIEIQMVHDASQVGLISLSVPSSPYLKPRSARVHETAGSLHLISVDNANCGSLHNTAQN